MLLFDPGRRIEYRLRARIFTQVLGQSRQFFRRYPVGEVMSRATTDLGQVRLLLGPGVLGVMNAIFGYAGADCMFEYFAITHARDLTSLHPGPARY